MINNNPDLQVQSAAEISRERDAQALEVKPVDSQQVEVQQNRFDKIVKQEGLGFSFQDGAEQYNAKNVADSFNSLMAGGLQRANKRAAELEEEDQIEAFDGEEREVNNLKIPVEETQASDQLLDYLYDEIDFVGDDQFLFEEWK